jgi:hypothetical protein
MRLLKLIKLAKEYRGSSSKSIEWEDACRQMSQLERSLLIKRWEEPFVEYYINGFLKLMEPTDLEMSRVPATSDPVYMTILNSDVRRKIVHRTMTEKTYLFILGKINNKQPRPGPWSGSHDIEEMFHKDFSITTLDRYAAKLTDGILSVESGFSEATTKKHLKRGLDGRQIMDMGLTLKDKRTNTLATDEMRKHKVDDWGGLIDIARYTKCTVRFLCGIMEQIGSREVADLEGAVEEGEPEVVEFTIRAHRSMAKGWYMFFKTYASQGGLLDNTITVFGNRPLTRLLDEDDEE